MANHDGYEVIGQIKDAEGNILTRTMSIYTKESYQSLWNRAPLILVNLKSAGPQESLMNYTVKPIQGNRNFPDSVGEVLMPPVDKPEPMGVVVQHPRNPDRYGDTLRQAAEAAVSKLVQARGAAAVLPYTPPVVTNVVIKPPEGVVEVELEMPTVVTLHATDKEGEVCFE